VISRLTPAQRDLLVQTSMLERLSGPLCDAVLDRTGSADVLASLDRANLFVTPLDSRGDWYRCHRLFRDALHHELSADTASMVRARAADWFAAQGLLDDAIELRIEADDPVEARRMLRNAAPWFLQHGAGRIVRLGHRLGLTAVASDPGLCASLGWAAASAGAFDQMPPWLDAAGAAATSDAEPPPGWHTLSGAVASLRSVHLLATTQLEAEVGDTGTDSGVDVLTLAARGVAAETDPSLPGYVLSRHILGTAYLASGRPLEAMPSLTEAWRHVRRPGFAPILSLQTACSLALALFQRPAPRSTSNLRHERACHAGRGTSMGRRGCPRHRPTRHGSSAACLARRRD
jgi:LuxR family maltose regulon positive regulatory protein